MEGFIALFIAQALSLPSLITILASTLTNRFKILLMWATIASIFILIGPEIIKSYKDRKCVSTPVNESFDPIQYFEKSTHWEAYIKDIDRFVYANSLQEMKCIARNIDSEKEDIQILSQSGLGNNVALASVISGILSQFVIAIFCFFLMPIILPIIRGFGKKEAN